MRPWMVVAQAPSQVAVVIVGTEIAGGTGAPLRRGSVRLQGDTTVDVGSQVPQQPGDTVVDGAGLVLALADAVGRDSQDDVDAGHRLGLPDWRGIAPSMKADLVLFVAAAASSRAERAGGVDR